MCRADNKVDLGMTGAIFLMNEIYFPQLWNNLVVCFEFSLEEVRKWFEKIFTLNGSSSSSNNT